MPIVFISYSHRDEAWRSRLEKHLAVLKGRVDLEVWHDRLIPVGQSWRKSIRAAMDGASVVIMLISADYLASEFIVDEEIERALRRLDKDGISVQPMIVRPCAWTEIPWLEQMRVWPDDAKPLSAMRDPEWEESLAAFTKSIVPIVGLEQPQAPRATIYQRIKEEGERLSRSHRWEKGLLYWDLHALPIECTRNDERVRDGKEVPAADLWGQGDRLVLLLGPPACGKTTYCRRLEARPPEATIPIDVGHILPCEEDVLLSLVAGKAETNDRQFARDLEAEGNLLFIADGVGEKRKAQRIVECLDDLSSRLQNSRFLVTCRSGDWPQDRPWLPQFTKWFILDLNSKGWDGFLESQDKELQRRMRNALSQQPELRKLCQNQFLFLIAANVMAKEEGAILTPTRVELYDRFLHRLLTELEELTPIARAAIVECLQGIAVEMRLSGEDRTRLSHARLQDVLRPWLPPGVGQEVMEEELEHLYHIGLVEESRGGIRFFQENFQEYLCAKWLTARFGGFPIDEEIWCLCQEVFTLLNL